MPPLRPPFAALLAVLATLPLVAQTQPAASPKPPARPNFVVLFLEGTGAGWASTSVAMDDRRPDAKAFAAQTPNLQRLASDGMR
ncbi:MAG: hypothetical protein JNK15_20820, partial [Planctomycetes bacterium]|nr:hypothetical protein [Planctomycetota bacterium]